jgi:hypothetical protein
VSKGSYSERARRRRPARPLPIPRMGAFSPYWLALPTRAMTRAVGPSVSLGIHIRGSQSRAKANAPFGIPCRTDIILQGNTVSFGIRLFDVKGLGRIKRFCTICAGSVGSNEASPICARLLTRQGHRPPRSQGKLRLTPSSPSSPSSSVRPRSAWFSRRDSMPRSLPSARAAGDPLMRLDGARLYVVSASPCRASMRHVVRTALH